MLAIDFPNSYLTWRTDWLVKPSQTASNKPRYTLNNARIPLDSRCEIVEKKSGASREFVLGVSCKTERVCVEQDIWTEPNADFVPIFSRDEFMMVKTFDRVGKTVQLYPPSLGDQPERQIGRTQDNFDAVRIDVAYREGEPLETAERIVEAVLSNRQLVARTEYENDRYSVVLDYPVKTINANERDGVYQTDTGPHLFPDLTVEPGDLLSGLELAFSAFNTPQWTEFIVRAPTPLTDDISVYHYSRAVGLDTVNQIVQL